MPKMIVIRHERCMGCRQCMIECAMAHTEAPTLVEAVRSGAALQPRVHVEPAGLHGMPLQCRHCEDAPCMTVCPTEAIHRPVERGPVLIDAARCIGCKFCLLACPFGVIEQSRDGKATVKCDLCIKRTEAGQEPACVAGCPTGALQFCEIDEWLREQRRATAERVAEGGARAQRAAAEFDHGR